MKCLILSIDHYSLDYRYLRLVSKKLEFVHATIYPDFTSIAKEEITWVLPHLMISKFLNTFRLRILIV